MKKIMLFFVTFFLGATLAFAAYGPKSGENPKQVIQDVSNALIMQLKTQRAAIDKDPKVELFKIVKQVVLPYIDMDAMVKMTLGRQGNMEWAKASASEKKEFEDQFLRLVVGTYAAALKEYDDEKVFIYPVRGFKSSMTEVNVQSQIVTKAGSKVSIEYDMIKEGDKWYAQDFTVEGISLVNSYQAQFQAIISDKGLKGLIQTLKQHNEANK